MTDESRHHNQPTQAGSWKDDWKQDVTGHAQLREIHETLRDQIGQRWNRSVPFADELFDRWERADYLGFGNNASIYDSSLVLGDVQVGEGTWIGPFTILDGRGGLAIGSYCSISAGVQVYTHDTVAWALTGGRAPEQRAPTRVGDCCFIGPNSIIQKGLTIGDHSVVGAQSFVRQDVPPYSIAVGSPAQLVGRVEIEDNEIRLHYFSRS